MTELPTRYATKPTPRHTAPPARLTVILARETMDTLTKLCPTPRERENFILRAIHNEIRRVTHE